MTDQPSDYEEQIKRIVDQAPPLTQTQRDKLAVLLADDSEDDSRPCGRG
jgi:hypothetical protein